MGLHGPTPKGGNAAAGGAQTAGQDIGADGRGAWDTLDYSPLPAGKSIRLLTLHPGQDGEPLQMCLSHHVLSDGGRDSFSALSYAWGDATDLQPVSCDGKTIGISKNLSACLKHIRLADAARILWIDVICINQEDLEERASQVGIMGEIYSKAEKVLIWLGEGNEDTKNGVFSLESMAKAWDPPVDQPVSFTTVLEFARASRIRRLDYWALGRQQYVRSISDSPWFTRAWTFQEVGLSSDAEVWIGSHHLSFKNLVYAWLVSLHHNFERTIFLNGYGRTTDTGRTCMHAMFAYWFLQNHGTPEEVREWYQLPRLLRLRQLHEASDPRDLVFSLISLSKMDPGETLQANYRMPVEDVFTQFAIKAIIESGDLSLLSERERQGSDPALPSWVPDWRCPPATTPLNALLPTAWRKYRVGQDRPEKSSPLDNISSPDGKGLRLMVTHIDTVKESYAVNYAMLHVPAEMRSMDWSETAKGLWYKALGYVKLDLHRSELLLELMANVEKAIKGRQLIVTEKGYLGLGALDVQPGDRVSILGNSPVPFLLRPRDGEPGTYSLVGECYVHGIMDGELWRRRPELDKGAWRADDKTLQIVEINLV
ncbi:heterokaryon incompatibility protein-domain-containing protein [Coniochaeta sp. 2T2.1]|nr:heterokaryon incompatibility protein-domain-containing protein [Coniochaeta sp. 2T2.1]